MKLLGGALGERNFRSRQRVQLDGRDGILPAACAIAGPVASVLSPVEHEELAPAMAAS